MFGFIVKNKRVGYALFPPLTQGFYLEKACIKSCFDVWFYCKKQKGWICTVSSPNQIEILNCFNSEKKPCAYAKSSLTRDVISCTTCI